MVIMALSNSHLRTSLTDVRISCPIFFVTFWFRNGFSRFFFCLLALQVSSWLHMSFLYLTYDQSISSNFTFVKGIDYEK